MEAAILETATGSAPGNATWHARMAQWWSHWGLAIAAILAWVFLVMGAALDAWTDAGWSVVLACYIASYLAGGTMAAVTAITDLLDRRVNIDLLMVTAAIGAALIGSWVEGAILLGLFSTSNALEHYALDRTRNAVRALMDLSPDVATVAGPSGETVVPVERLAVGDTIVVRPGERIPADAEIVSGTTEVDQSAITGESMPIARTAGHPVFAGTVNGSGAFRAQVTHLPSESTLARITRMVAEAQDQKGRAERFTDRFEGPYAIGVIVFAVLVWIVPILFGADRSDAFYRAITVLVVASPCALVISTPAATLSAIANAARNGVLVKGGSYLDDLGVVDTIAFDKTGTLTLGHPSLTDLRVFGDTDESAALRLVAAVEHLSEHPIAKAIVDGAEAAETSLPAGEGFASEPGKGVEASVEGVWVGVGNERMFEERGIPVSREACDAATEIRSAGKTAVLGATNSGVFAVVGVADKVRPGVVEALAELRELGVERMVMLTGDHRLVAEAIAAQVGIDEIHAELQPDEKLEMIGSMQRGNRLATVGDNPSRRVAMVGDGINDAPALASADLGVAMGAGGTDVALETADVVLITGDLRRLAYAIRLSRRMRTTIRFCIGFALTVIVVLLALSLTVGIPLPLGVVGHEGSTIVVVVAGLSLLLFGRGTRRGSRPGVAAVPTSQPAGD